MFLSVSWSLIYFSLYDKPHESIVLGFIQLRNSFFEFLSVEFLIVSYSSMTIISVMDFHYILQFWLSCIQSHAFELCDILKSVIHSEAFTLLLLFSASKAVLRSSVSFSSLMYLMLTSFSFQHVFFNHLIANSIAQNQYFL